MKSKITILLVILFSILTFSQINPNSGLVAYFPFNGNATDESGSGHDGTINGNVVLTADRFNAPDQAYTFLEQASCISLANTVDMQLQGGFTINAWIKYKSGGQKVIVCKHQCGTSNGFVFLIDSDGQVKLYVCNSGWSIVGTDTSFIDNKWYMVTATFDSTGGSEKVYVDGQLSGTGSASYYGFSANPVTIGESYQNNCTSGNMDGAIDEVKIYDRALDSFEIMELFDASAPVVVQSVYPDQNSSYFKPDETMSVYLSDPVNPSTVNNSSVFVKGNLIGWYSAIPVYNSDNNSIELTPESPFNIGEEITVSVTNEVIDTAGNSIVPFVFTFKVKPHKGSVKFVVADSLQLDFPPTQVTSADLNNDGLIDVVASSYDSAKVVIALNQGNGLFSAGTLISGDLKPSQCVISDIDNNQDVDLIFPAPEQNKIYLYKNDGAGNFTYFDELDVTAVAVVCPGDFDGEGNTDLVALTNTPLAITFKNNGQGIYTEYSSISVSGVPLRTIVGDIDNDGDLDVLAGTSDYWGVFKILKNDGQGNFSFVGGPYLGPYPDELAGGDFDGDYDLDFVKCDWYQNGIGIAVNNGSGEYPVENFLNLGNVGGQTRNPVVSDFDGDGDLDFVGIFYNNNLGIAKNNGYPNYGFYLSYSIPGLKGITAGDFDNNGSMDLVGVTSDNKIKFIKNCVDSLVAYWSFNGNITDTSGNFNNGVNNGGVFDFDRLGNIDQSINFDGADGYIQGNNPGYNLPAGDTPRSFSCWVKSSPTTVSRNIFHYGTAEAAPTNYHLFLQEGKYVGVGNGYGFGFLQSNKDIGDNTWHFITSVYEGNGTDIQHIYIDGKLDTSAVISTTPNTILATNWKMSQFMGGSPGFLGNIDELKIYNIVLSADDIWNNYLNSTTSPMLLYPQNNSAVGTLTPLLDWDSTITATTYKLNLSTDSLFDYLIIDQDVSTSFYPIQFGVLQIDTKYFWRVRTVNDGGMGPWSEVYNFESIITDIKKELQIPTVYSLLQNYPNPFNPTTKISYTIPEAGLVVLTVYDLLGNEVAELVNGNKQAGSYEVEFRGVNLASGIYIYKLSVNEFISTKKMILMR